jgi:hypothetical protein
MIIDIKQLLQDCYLPCVIAYFAPDIFHTHSFLKNIYDMEKYRNANVKAIYMFPDSGHSYTDEDAESFFLKHGIILLPLFLPVNYTKYADERVISDFVLTMYSPMLVGIWNKALDYINNENAFNSDGGHHNSHHFPPGTLDHLTRATTSSAAAAAATTSTTKIAAAPIEIHVKWDLTAPHVLKELRNRIQNRLFNMTDGNKGHVFKQMSHTTVKMLEQKVKPKGW